MKRIVFIDGENLNYALRVLDRKNGGDGKRDFLYNFNYRGMLNDILEDLPYDEVFWYGAKISIKSNAEDMVAKKEELLKFHSKFVNTINKQNIKYQKIGYLRDRKKSDSSEPYLIEKGVDVGMAVDMIKTFHQDNNTKIVVVSADTDMLPALDYLKQMGAEIVYIGYEHLPIYSIQKRADIVRMLTMPIFKKNKKIQLTIDQS